MATIRIYDGTNYTDVEVTEEIAVCYTELERAERLNERRETRRHQSLNRSMEHGWDIADTAADIYTIVERHELADELYHAIFKLTERQRIVFLSHVLEEKPFREIGEMLSLGTYTVRDYFYNVLKKLKKILTHLTPKQ